MTWAPTVALVVCAVACFVAAELAGGLREHRRGSQLWLLAAVLTFLAAVVLLVDQPLPAGFPRFLGIAAAALSAVACFWFVKVHAGRGQPYASLVSAALGLAMVGAGAFVGVSASEPGTGAADTATDATERNSIDAQRQRLSTRRRELELRLAHEIPDFRRKLDDDAATVQAEMQRASAGTQQRLEEELREIARLLLAVDKEEQASNDLVVRLNVELRRLERLRGSQSVLGDNAELLAELDRVWQQAGAQLSQPISDRLAGGAVGELELEQKLGELLGR